MSSSPLVMMVDPMHYEVRYAINPWMEPGRWSQDPDGFRQRAIDASLQLRDALVRAGCRIEWAPGSAGLPDMVFPANAAVVLDGRAMMARFRYPQRQGEEAPFHAIFESLRERGLIRQIERMPEGVFQEGAGDCIWDAERGWFWAGFGPRSSAASLDVLRDYFGRPVVPLGLASERCYHLDVCFLPLSGGEILYLPDALTPQARDELQRRVPASLLMPATEEDLRHFNINAVNVGRTIVMSRATASLRERLEVRGYELIEVDLAPFMMSGGGAYCMTLRLDRSSRKDPAAVSPEPTRAAA
ncbi:MAG: arginine deiminase-related protein [Burkholderiaceae bacterium]